MSEQTTDVPQPSGIGTNRVGHEVSALQARIRNLRRAVKQLEKACASKEIIGQIHMERGLRERDDKLAAIRERNEMETQLRDLKRNPPPCHRPHLADLDVIAIIVLIVIGCYLVGHFAHV